jgi:hypothetical protein
MNYNVNIFGGGDVQLIVQDLRKLAQKLEDSYHEDLRWDGFETGTLVMELGDYVEEPSTPEATETVVCTEEAWKTYVDIKNNL